MNPEKKLSALTEMFDDLEVPASVRYGRIPRPDDTAPRSSVWRGIGAIGAAAAVAVVAVATVATHKQGGPPATAGTPAIHSSIPAPTATFNTAITGKVTEFYGPAATSGLYSIISGPDGNLWFTESASSASGGNKIGRMSTSGQLISEWTLPNADSTPQSIVVGPDGAVWFTEFDGKRIGRITAAGLSTLTEYQLQFKPVQIIVGPDRNLWFSADLALNVMPAALPMKVIHSYPVPNTQTPTGLVAGIDGTSVWFTDSHYDKVGRMDLSGHATVYTNGIGGGDHPSQIVAGVDGNYWVIDSGDGRISKLTSLGVSTSQKLLNGGACTFGIVSAPDQFVYCTDSSGATLWRVAEDGSSVHSFPLPSKGAYGITIGSDGNIWYVNNVDGSIGRVE